MKARGECSRHYLVERCLQKVATFSLTRAVESFLQRERGATTVNSVWPTKQCNIENWREASGGFMSQFFPTPPVNCSKIHYAFSPLF